MSTSDPASHVRSLPVLVAVVALAGALYGGYAVASYQGTDENGYLITAKRLATRGQIAKQTADINEFVSSNWVETELNRFYAKYPIGYPLLCAAAYRLGGADAVFWVNPLLATLAVGGIFFLGRAMLGDFGGTLAAIVLATNPMNGFYGISALSHSGAICFAVWGMYFLWRWSERGGWLNAALAGALSAFAVSVRYTEALLALPVLAMVAWRFGQRWRESGLVSPPLQPIECEIRPSAPRFRSLPWGQLAVMVVAALLAIAPLIAQHLIAYGSPWVSGYSLCGEDTGFGWRWFTKNWRLMLSRLDYPGLFLMFPLGVAGLCYLAAHRPKEALFLGLWILPSLLLYTAYYWAPEGDGPWYVRFFVSIFPPLIISGLALPCLAVKSRPGWNVALGLFVMLVAGVNLHETIRQLDRRNDSLLFTRALWEAVRQNVPDGAVVLSEEGVLNHVEFVGEYTLYPQGVYERNALKHRLKVLEHDDPNPFQRQKARRIQEWIGTKTDAQLNDLLCDHLARHLEAGQPVALITPQGSVGRWRGRLSHRYWFETAAELAEWRISPKGETNISIWCLFHLSPLSEERLALAKASRVLETKIEQMRFRIDALKSVYNQQYPGAQEDWKRISDLEKQHRELQEELRKTRAQEKALAREKKQDPPPPSGGGAATATPPPTPTTAATGPSTAEPGPPARPAGPAGKARIPPPAADAQPLREKSCGLDLAVLGTNALVRETVQPSDKR